MGREVRIANDANCMTVSEATDGAGAGKRSYWHLFSEQLRFRYRD